MRIVKADIIEKDGKYLIARRGPLSKLAGQWEFPGGKVEENETLQECLKRELLEELSIDVVVGDHFHSSDYNYEHGSFRIESFKVIITGGEIILKDHDIYKWVSANELDLYPLLPADIPIATKLKSK